MPLPKEAPEEALCWVARPLLGGRPGLVVVGDTAVVGWVPWPYPGTAGLGISEGLAQLVDVELDREGLGEQRKTEAACAFDGRATAIQRITTGRVRPPDYAYEWTDSSRREDGDV